MIARRFAASVASLLRSGLLLGLVLGGLLHPEEVLAQILSGSLPIASSATGVEYELSTRNKIAQDFASKGYLEEAVSEYSFVIDHGVPSTQEAVDALWGRMNAYVNMEEFDLAEEDYYAIRDTDPNYPRVERNREGQFVITNFHLDKGLLLQVLMAIGFVGTPEDIVTGAKPGEFLVPESLWVGGCCVCSANDGSSVSTSLYCSAQIIQPNPIDPPPIGGRQYPDRFKPPRGRRSKPEGPSEGGIKGCKQWCNRCAIALSGVAGYLPIGVVWRVLGGVGIEILREQCERCCESGNFYGVCVAPIVERTALLREMLADIGSWPDPIWNHD